MVSRFSVFNATCTGASHIRGGKPCQDFSVSLKTKEAAIIAVADGHGSDAYFRSDRGARFAAEAAVQCIQELLAIYNSGLYEQGVNAAETVLKNLEKNIVDAWHNNVENDIKQEEVDADGFMAYGTTLLAAAMTKSYWFALQIGDGKCVIINEDNSVMQPVIWDNRCFLNRTTSLCDVEAINLFRHFYSETLPLAVFLGSDGIDDSFPINRNEGYLANFYISVYRNFLEEGLEKGELQLREILPKITLKGSSDDVSVAGIIRNIDTA